MQTREEDLNRARVGEVEHMLQVQMKETGVMREELEKTVGEWKEAQLKGQAL